MAKHKKRSRNHCLETGLRCGGAFKFLVVKIIFEAEWSVIAPRCKEGFSKSEEQVHDVDLVPRFCQLVPSSFSSPNSPKLDSFSAYLFKFRYPQHIHKNLTQSNSNNRS